MSVLLQLQMTEHIVVLCLCAWRPLLTNRSCAPKVSGVPFGERKCYKSLICTQPFPEGMRVRATPKVRARFVRNGRALRVHVASTSLTFGERSGRHVQLVLRVRARTCNPFGESTDTEVDLYFVRARPCVPFGCTDVHNEEDTCAERQEERGADTLTDLLCTSKIQMPRTNEKEGVIRKAWTWYEIRCYFATIQTRLIY